MTAWKIVQTMPQLPLKLFMLNFFMYSSLISYWNMHQLLKYLYFPVLGEERVFHDL